MSAIALGQVEEVWPILSSDDVLILLPGIAVGVGYVAIKVGSGNSHFEDFRFTVAPGECVSVGVTRIRVKGDACEGDLLVSRNITGLLFELVVFDGDGIADLGALWSGSRKGNET